MIGRKDSGEKPTTEGVNAYVGRKTAFEGKIRFEGIFRIDGTYKGEILSGDTLVVGETAEVSAEIRVNTLSVRGKVHGNVTAERRITIHPPGKIRGNIQTPVLAISEGGIFHGNCKMIKAESTLGGKIAPLKPTDENKGEIVRGSR